MLDIYGAGWCRQWPMSAGSAGVPPALLLCRRSGRDARAPRALAQAPMAAISGPEINAIAGVSGMSTEAETVAQTHPFQAEVAELLRLMVHSVYSEADVFLRELISNASDACDKLRYEAIA